MFQKPIRGMDRDEIFEKIGGRLRSATIKG
jgi:hypothetical protein